MMSRTNRLVRPEFFSLVDLQGFFQIKGRGYEKKISSENDQFNGHFQSFFFHFQSFFSIKYLQKNSKTSEVNQQSVLNLYIFHHFPKSLDRTITFNSVTLKNTQTEPQKYIIFFQLNK